MTITGTTNASGVIIAPKGSNGSTLDQTAFLKLMTTQLKQQDPFSPMDNTQMVAQMAQFSSVAGIAEMNGSLRIIGEQISDQTDLLKKLIAK